MDQLDLIRGFRRQLAALRPDAKARARRALQEHMTAATPSPPRPRVPRIPFPRHTLSVAAVATAIGAAVAVVLLLQGVRDGSSPARPAAVVAQPSPPDSAGASLPVSASYRDYLQFASRMTRLDLRTGAERTELPAGASFCAQAELAEIERLAIETLTAAGWPRGRPVLDGGVAVELDESSACRYAGFGVERARAVYAGLLPASNLMPEAQGALPGLGLTGKPLL
jgi:hypothetical protein